MAEIGIAEPYQGGKLLYSQRLLVMDTDILPHCLQDTAVGSLAQNKNILHKLTHHNVDPVKEHLHLPDTSRLHKELLALHDRDMAVQSCLHNGPGHQRHKLQHPHLDPVQAVV